MRGTVTQDDVARAAGVSRALVSMALSDSPRVAWETKARILTVVKELGYSKDLSASMLSSKKSDVVGVVFPHLHNLYFADLLEEVHKRAEVTGLLPLLAAGDNQPGREMKLMQRFREMRVQGVICVSPVLPRSELRDYGSNVPLVVIGEGPIGGFVDSLSLDEADAAQSIVNHSVDRQWDTVFYLFDTRAGRDRGLKQRRKALEVAAAQGNIDFHWTDTGGHTTEVVLDFIHAAGRRRLLLVAHNDYMAVEITASIRGAGLELGGEIGVISYDDTYFAKRDEISLTSMSQPLDRFAASAIEWISSRSLEPTLAARSLVFPASLVARSSS